ncbi:MAG: sulfotransferase domain-containing protein [Anaerolineales bacterium]|nr:sulfotransferase domain-containing protein [Anaerolineales bacterium]
MPQKAISSYLKVKGSMIKGMPNFYIIGAAKAGTTSLYEMIKGHPDVYLSYAKEPMFFSKDEYYLQGPKWYKQSFFQDSEDYALRGEATPHYLYWADKVAPRMAEQYQAEAEKPKLIVILRDPVKRSYSWYWNMIKEGTETLPFAEALQKEDARLVEFAHELTTQGSMQYGYVRGSMYARQIRKFLEFFSKDSFYFLLQEDLLDPTNDYLQGLYGFLNIEPAQFKKIQSNKAGQPLSRTVQTLLRGRSRAKDVVKRLLPLEMRYRLKTFLMRSNTKPFAYPPMDPNLENHLRHRFAEGVRDLELIIQRDLSAWLPS